MDIKRNYYKKECRSEDVNLVIETIKISIVYFIISMIWMYFSNAFIQKYYMNNHGKIHKYMDVMYIIITTVVLSILNYRKISITKKAMEKMNNNYKELIIMHEELISKKEQLKDQLKLENKLKMEREFSQNIINNVNVMIIIFDIEGKIKTVNSFAQSLLEYSKNELKDMIWIEKLIPQKNKKEIYNIFNRIISGEIIKNYENQLINKSGRIIDVLWNTTIVNDETGNILEIVSVGTDITTFKAMKKNIYDLVYYDVLTNLYNRNKIKKELEKLINKKGNNNLKFALLYIGIDDFKYINDSLGQINGDKLLVDLSRVIKNIFYSSKIIGRVNGDEFVVVLEYEDDENYIIRKINKFLEELKVPWELKDKDFQITVSIGIALYPFDGKDFTTLFENAYTAMLYKKKMGKNGYQFYSCEIYKKNLNYINTVNELRKGIKNKEFILFYQPQVNLVNGSIIGVESLIRWKHPQKGIISPMEFIPLSEQIGYIHEISKWVVETACMQKKQWEEKGFKDLEISINISNDSLKEKNFLKDFTKILEKYNVDKKGIIIEITETAIMHNLEEGIRILKELRKSGIKIALDDFGTGYSSLNYLRKLPIDILKIDRDFIKDIGYEMQNEVIFKHIIELGHTLELQIIGEGIESLQQLSLVKKYGCDIGQGYLFSKPLEVKEIEKLLKFHI